MQLKSLLLIAFCTFGLCSASVAQDFAVPQQVSMEAKEDYAKYEKDIIAASKWLEATPVREDDEKRVMVNAFVMKWITGSPTVTISIDGYAMKLLDKNPQLLMVFMAGYARYVLENNYSADGAKAYAAGVKSAITNYGLGGAVKKNKVLEKAVEKDKEGKLLEWVSSNMSKN